MRTLITIASCYEKEITGINHSYHAVFKKTSFSNPDDEKRFNHFFQQNQAIFARQLFNGFIPFDCSSLKGQITLFPAQKGLKEIDFLRICPRKAGIWVALSEKAWCILAKFNLPPTHRIPVRVDGFAQQYYLIGFPMITTDAIDFTPSEFIHISSREIVCYDNHHAYENRADLFDIAPSKIVIRGYGYDVLNMATLYELSVAPEIIKEFTAHGCVGITKRNAVLVVHE